MRGLVKLFDEQQILARVEELARDISSEFRDEKIALVAALKGSVFFLADIARRMDVPVELDFVSAHSYAGNESAGTVRVEKGPSLDLKGANVILVEDIIDTGRTCARLVELIGECEPAVLKICTLFDKPGRRAAPISADYVGFTIEDRFIVGYGLDHNERYRNLRAVYYIEDGPDPM